MRSWETGFKRLVRLRLESRGVRVCPLRLRRPLDPYGLSDRDDDPLLSLAPSIWPFEPEHKAHAASLHYAGEGMWSYEEDIYNPAEFGEMIKGWLATKQRLTGDR